jgi:5-methylthioadenosine/S-adenosylhomocysteine deaminase
MRVAALLHKHANSDPRALSARTALEMATIRGARALGLDKRIGTLEPKKLADLITVSVSGARQTPMYDAVSHLVYVIRGADVQTTVVNGRILMRNRKVLTIDEQATLAEGRAWIDKVRAAVK